MYFIHKMYINSGDGEKTLFSDKTGPFARGGLHPSLAGLPSEEGGSTLNQRDAQSQNQNYSIPYPFLLMLLTIFDSLPIDFTSPVADGTVSRKTRDSEQSGADVLAGIAGG